MSEASAENEPVRGFTLIEMLVVLVIIVVVTAIALLGQTTFNRSLILTDTAYTVAFSVHQAQSLGLSSKAVVLNDVSHTLIQNAGYGVHVSVPANSYDLFADTDPLAAGNIQNVSSCPGHTIGAGPEARPGDCMDTVGQDIPVQTYHFNQGFTISKFCGAKLLNGNPACSSSTGLTTVDIVYLRPNTQSMIIAHDASGGTPTPLSDVVLYVAAPDSTTATPYTRCVSVSKVGQITVKSCP